MTSPLILLHEEALRISHPVFNAAPTGTRGIFVWDDAYFKNAGHSLKRLIFIYETLCELPVDIIKGDTLEVIRALAPTTLYVPTTNNPLIVGVINLLKAITVVENIQDDVFTKINEDREFRRFFQYWNKAKTLAFLQNGWADA